MEAHGEMIRGIVEMIIVGLCWTSFGVVMGFAPKRKVDVGIMLFFSSIAAMVVCGTMGIVSGFPENVPAFPFWITAGSLFVCGALNYVQLDLMARAMARGPNGIIWSVIQCSFVFPFLTGVLFFQAKCSFWNGLGSLLIVCALLILGLGKENKVCGNWKLFTFLSLVSTGIAQILSNLPSYYPEANAISSTWRSAYFALGLAFGTVGGSLLLLRKRLLTQLRENVANRNMWIFVVVLQGFEILASIFLLYPGMNRLAGAGAGAIAYPLVVASGIVGFELYTLIGLKEKRSFLQILAFFMTLSGIALLCL